MGEGLDEPHPASSIHVAQHFAEVVIPRIFHFDAYYTAYFEGGLML